MWVEKSRQVPIHLLCATVLNKSSAAQKANSNTVVSGRVLNKPKKPRSEKSRQVQGHLRCDRVINKRSVAQKANSNTVVSGRVLTKAKKTRSVT